MTLVRAISSSVVLLITVSCQQSELDAINIEGVYESKCCDAINVAENQIGLNNQIIPFQFYRDNVGYFLLPEVKIGIRDNNVVKLSGVPTYIRASGRGGALVLAIEDASNNELRYFYRRQSQP